ncbi:hypothetical protein P279_29000, partial [Rhodobacteraceae bacterium PD-2]
NARFDAGRIYTILGRTGAGKTELLRTLIGLDAVASGTIRLDGTDLSRVAIRNRQMAMVYQQFINYPHLSVLDNVAFPLRRQGLGRSQANSRAAEALRLVGLADFAERRPSALSGGQQQRVALARAIVKKARILLMDEPLANLDYKLREQLREEFPRLLRRSVGGVILYTTTEPAEAIQLGDRMIVMHEGRIVAEGEPAALFNAPPTVDVARVVSDPPISIFAGTVGTDTVHLAGNVTVPVSGLGMPPGQALQVGIRPDGLLIGGGIPSRITLSEFSGSDTIVHLHLPFGDAVMLLDGIHDMRPGTELGVAIDPARLLIFREDGTYYSGGSA